MALDQVGLSTQIWRWAVSPIDNLIHGLQCKQYPCLWFVILWLRGSAPCLPLLSMFLLDLFPTHESAEQFIAIHVCFQLLRVAWALQKLCGSREITVLEDLTVLGGVAVWSSGHELTTMAIFWAVHFVQFLRLQQPCSMGGLHQPSKTQFLLASWAFISPFLTLHVLFWI